MATEDRFEPIVVAALRRYLDGADGPHPVWSNAPVARMIAEPGPLPQRTRHWPRATLLLTAGLTVVLVSAAMLIGGGLTRPTRPLPGPTGAPPITPSTTPSDSSPSPSPAAVVVDPTPNDSPTPCVDSWSISRSKPQQPLADGIETVYVNGSGDHLFMVFGHPVDAVRSISFAPTQPPFVTSTGKAVKVAGNAFVKLTISGVNKPTVDPDDIVRTPSKAAFLRRMVAAPIAERRRIQTPVYSTVLQAPPKNGSTEVWIIGLDYSPCIGVQIVREDGYSSDVSGDNALIVRFDPPAPATSSR